VAIASLPLLTIISKGVVVSMTRALALELGGVKRIMIASHCLNCVSGLP